MNGQNPNELNNQNSLNATSLGAINNSSYPNQVPNMMPNQAQNPTMIPNQEPESLDVGVSQPLPNVNNTVNPEVTPVNNIPPQAQPIPGTEGTPAPTFSNLTANTVGISNSNLNNNFVSPQKIDNIGTIPPTGNEPSKKAKKPMNKVLFTILILILIAGVAYGVYYFLSQSKKVKLEGKTVNVEIGATLSTNINDYFTIKTGSSSLCNTVNVKNVDTKNPGSYKVTVTCGKDTYTSTVVVADKQSPQVSLKPVFKTVNDTLTINDFIISCTDASNCTTTFKDEATITNYLQTVSDKKYQVTINAKDDLGNEKEYNTDLYVLPYQLFRFINCEGQPENLQGYKATKTTSDIIPTGVNEEGSPVFMQVARREYKYTFEETKEYMDVIGKKDAIMTFDNVTGLAYYNDTNKTLIISVDLPIETLQSENNNAFPTSFVGIQNLYKDTKLYSCSYDQTYPVLENEEN